MWKYVLFVPVPAVPILLASYKQGRSYTMRRGQQPKRRHIFIGLGLVLGCVWYRHSINFWIHKTNLICRNSSCSWRFQRCQFRNYRISRGRAIRCDACHNADGIPRDGIYLLGLGLCVFSIFGFIKQTICLTKHSYGDYHRKFENC